MAVSKAVESRLVTVKIKSVGQRPVVSVDETLESKKYCSSAASSITYV